MSGLELLYANAAEEAFALLATAEQLSQSDENPLLNAICDIGTGGGRTGILLRDPSLISHVEKATLGKADLTGIKVVCAGDLKGPAEYDRLFIIGPTKWIPDYVLTAPRALDIRGVLYSWQQDQEAAKKAFISLAGKGGTGHLSGATPKEETDKGGEAIELDGDEFLPVIDLDHVGKRVSDGERPENIEALLLSLEGGVGVLMEAGEGPSALVIDPEEQGKSRVRRVQCGDLESGMFVMLRTVGGGDYIIPVADRLMENKAGAARDCQRMWKDALRRKVAQLGIAGACRELRRLGSERANPPNLRNWVSESFIKPQDISDFMAIAKLVGIEGQADTVWEAMCLIGRAHMTAGQRIRRLLLKQVLASDLAPLERQGQMDFELPEADGGTLTAFRIDRIAPKTVWVSPRRIGVTFRLLEVLESP